jgi:Cu/Ag efflux protein CusF
MSLTLLGKWQNPWPFGRFLAEPAELSTLVRLTLALWLVAAMAAGAVALANFTGAVHGISSKQITIENTDGNLIDFEINRKTKVMRGKQEIQPEEIMPGDQVAIQAKQQMLKFLIAVTITVQTQPKEDR